MQSTNKTERAAPMEQRNSGELPQIIERLRAVEKRLGRKIRVLLIGNIANNAYHLAKMLNSSGLECDCLCYDYYHMMGCPEWEDADYEGDISNDFRPDWWSVGLVDYERPKWFVQGPLPLCFDYLTNRFDGRTESARVAWRRLEESNGTRRPTFRSGAKLDQFWLRHVRRYWRYCRQPDTVSQRLHAISESWLAAHPTAARRGARLLLRPAIRTAAGASRKLERLFGTLAGDGVSEVRIRELHAKLAPQLSDLMPQRQDQLVESDVRQHTIDLEDWQSLLDRYDIVQGFATAPIVPMLAGREYFAFEHGTLREVPNWPNSTGRLTTLAYCKARHVFVTNSDCVPTAHRLAGDRVSFINHPFNEDDVVDISGWRELGAELRATLDSDHVVLHPTRQDWVHGTGYADKANDVFLRALGIMRSSGFRVGAVLCEWGANVTQSKALIAELGLGAHVRWVKPMPMRRFFRTALATGVVVDQFMLGAIGGVAFKSLAAGVPVCTSLDEPMAAKTFGTAPPVLNCRSTEELAEELPRFLASPGRRTALAKASREWFETHHSGRHVLTEHLARYLESLEQRQ